LIERLGAALYFDDDVSAVIASETCEPKTRGETENERAKSYALHDPRDGDRTPFHAARVLGRRILERTRDRCAPPRYYCANQSAGRKTNK